MDEWMEREMGGWMVTTVSVMYILEHLQGNHQNVAADTQHHLDCYAKDGLRTLCFATKVQNQKHSYFPASPLNSTCHCLWCVLQVVSEAAYRTWAKTRQAALAAIDNREQLVMDTAVQLETNLSLLGNTHQPSVQR